MQNTSSKDSMSGNWASRKQPAFHYQIASGTQSSGGFGGNGGDGSVTNQGNIPRNIPVIHPGDFEIRPESSMSNISTLTQRQVIPGGVSLSAYSQPFVHQATTMANSEYNNNFVGTHNSTRPYGHGSFNTAGDSSQGFQFTRPQAPPSPYLTQQEAFAAVRNMPPHLQSQGSFGRTNFNSQMAFDGNMNYQSPTDAHPPLSPAQVAKQAKALEISNMIRSGEADFNDEPVDSATYQKLSRGGYQAAQQRMSRNNAEAILASQPAITLNDLVNTRDTNTKGNAAAFLDVEPVKLPTWFARLSGGYKPTLEEFFDSLPVMEACRYAAASTAGVVRIRNIPYSTPRSEIAAFVGKNAKILPQPAGTPYYGVHIIMERHSGKTMDAFIEFVKPAEAVFVVSQFSKRIVAGRHPKIGDRHVEVEISSQEELMGELFPRAKHVVWEGSQPRVLQNNEEYYKGVKSAGFAGFLQNEEITMMVKHAETPNRSPFAQRSPVRTYESMISTLYKYPWFAHEHVLMKERRDLFDAAHGCVRALVSYLRRANSAHDQCKPTQATLKELVVAILTCPGFSETQKSFVAAVLERGGFNALSNSRGMNIRFGGITPKSSVWPFLVLVRVPGAHEHFVEYFASLMRLATTGAESVSLADAHAMRASAGTTSSFGRVNIDYGNARSIEDVGRIELRWLEKALGSVLPTSRQRAMTFPN